MSMATTKQKLHPQAVISKQGAVMNLGTRSYGVVRLNPRAAARVDRHAGETGAVMDRLTNGDPPSLMLWGEEG